MASLAPMSETYLRKLMRLEARNDRIRALRAKGWTFERIGNLYGLTRARIHKIVMNGSKNAR